MIGEQETGKLLWEFSSFGWVLGGWLFSWRALPVWFEPLKSNNLTAVRTDESSSENDENNVKWWKSGMQSQNISVY